MVVVPSAGGSPFRLLLVFLGFPWVPFWGFSLGVYLFTDFTLHKSSQLTTVFEANGSQQRTIKILYRIPPPRVSSHPAAKKAAGPHWLILPNDL